MNSIIRTIQEEVVDHIESGLTDSDGNQHMRVEHFHTGDEFEVTDFVADHQRRVGQIPHAFVFVGTATFQDQDSTARLQQVQVPVRVFVATRHNSAEDQRVQHQLGSKWSIYTAAALAGQPINTTGIAESYPVNMNVESLVNVEAWALWEVRFNVPISLDTDDILAQIDNE